MDFSVGDRLFGVHLLLTHNVRSCQDKSRSYICWRNGIIFVNKVEMRLCEIFKLCEICNWLAIIYMCRILTLLRMSPFWLDKRWFKNANLTANRLIVGISKKEDATWWDVSITSIKRLKAKRIISNFHFQPEIFRFKVERQDCQFDLGLKHVSHRLLLANEQMFRKVGWLF